MRYLCFADAYVRVVEGARPLLNSFLANAFNLRTSNPTSESTPGPLTGGYASLERERESRIGYSWIEHLLPDSVCQECGWHAGQTDRGQ